MAETMITSAIPTTGGKDVIRYGTRRSAGAEHPFTAALRVALKRNGMTLAQACSAAELDVGNVSRWTAGRRGPLYESLNKLVVVLDAPELFDAIGWRPRSQFTGELIDFVCVGYKRYGRSNDYAGRCKRIYTLTDRQAHSQMLAQARAASRRTEPKRWEGVFIDSTSKTMRCKACERGSMRHQVVTQPRLKKVRVRTGSYETQLVTEPIRSRAQERELFQQAMPELVPMFGSKEFAQAALATRKERRKSRGGVTARQRRAISRGKLSEFWAANRCHLPHAAVDRCGGDVPEKIVRPCFLCGKWMIVPPNKPETRFHRECLRLWRGTEAGRAWAKGRRYDPADLEPRKPAHRPKKENFVRELAWSVQHHIGGQSLPAIAARERLHHSTIDEAINKFLDDLPRVDQVPAEYQKMIAWLLEARRLRDAARLRRTGT